MPINLVNRIVFVYFQLVIQFYNPIRQDNHMANSIAVRYPMEMDEHIWANLIRRD